LEILFLGSSAGVPTKTRNVSAIALIESKGSAWYLIDCGEGTQHQLLHSPLSLNSLAGVFLTHLHGDHCYGLPGLLASAGLTGRTNPLKIVAPVGTQEWIETTKKISDLHLPYELEFIETDVQSESLFGQFRVSAVALSHRITSFGYIFRDIKHNALLDIEKIRSAGIPQGALWGQLQAGADVTHDGQTFRATDFVKKQRPRKFVICGDNDQPALLTQACANCDLLVHECTFAQNMAQRAKSVGHSYTTQIASFAQTARIPNLVLTHISARYGADTTLLEHEAMQAYSGNLFLAQDFDQYKLDTSSNLELITPRSTG